MKKLNTDSCNQTELPNNDNSLPRSFATSCRVKLAALKANLVRRFTGEFFDLKTHLIEQMVNEAEALASLTEMPHLFLPALAEEKVQSARNRILYQQKIKQRSRFIPAA